MFGFNNKSSDSVNAGFMNGYHNPFISNYTTIKFTETLLNRLIRQALVIPIKGIDEKVKQGMYQTFFFEDNKYLSFRKMILNSCLGVKEFTIINDVIVVYIQGREKKKGIPFYLDIDYFDRVWLLRVEAEKNNLYQHFNIASNMANTPILKINPFVNSTTDTDEGRNQAEDWGLKILKDLESKDKSMLIMSKESDFFLTEIKIDTYVKAMEWVNVELSKITGMPSSWITGQTSGGLNTTGEGEARQINQVLVEFSTNVIVPILQRIHDLIGIRTVIELDYETIETAQDKIKNNEEVKNNEQY